MNDSEGERECERENGKKPKAKNRNQAAQQQKTHHIIVQWSAIFACVSLPALLVHLPLGVQWLRCAHYYFAGLVWRQAAGSRHHKRRLKPDLCLIMVISTRKQSAKENQTRRDATCTDRLACCSLRQRAESREHHDGAPSAVSLSAHHAAAPADNDHNGNNDVDSNNKHSGGRRSSRLTMI